MKIIDNVRLEVDIPTEPMNRLVNPAASGYPLGGYGWVTDLPGDSVTVDPIDTYFFAHKYSYLGGREAVLYSEFFPTDLEEGGNKYCRATMRIYTGPSTGFCRLFVDWHDNAGNLLSWTQFGQHSPNASFVTFTSGAMTVPANAVRARIRVRMFGNGSFNSPPPGSGSVHFIYASAAIASSTGALPANFAAKHNWVNILGPSTTVSISREAMNLGTLSATVKDATLDPATSGAIRQGKAARVMVKDGIQWKPIFTGTVSTANTTYDRTGKPTIQMTALDNMQRLANSPRPYGVGVPTHLAAVLEGTGVPWNIFGLTGHTAQSNVQTSYNENSSAADQVALLRDSLLNYAWVDESGVLQYQTLESATSVATLDESVYGGIDVDFNGEECINSIIVNKLVYNASTNETEEVQYGPYEDLRSQQRWGIRQATVTISTGDPQAWATSVLEANAHPEVRINSMSIPVKEVGPVALLDLCDLVTTVYAPKSINKTARVFSVEHTITPEAWSMEVGFDAPDSVASPQQQPQLSTDSAYLTPWGRYERTTAQSIGATAWTALTPNVTPETTGGLEWDSTLNAFVIRKDGLYTINANVRWAAGAANYRGAGIYVNGSLIRYNYDDVTSTTLGVSSSASTVTRLKVGDTVQARVYSGVATTTLAGASGATALDLAWVGP